MSEYLNIQRESCEGNLSLVRSGLVKATFGNVSVADRAKGVFAIKPSGIEYSELNPEKIVIVDFEGAVVYGTLRPSSDTKTHAVLYKNCPGINAIVHTHSTYATAWAQALRDIPNYGTTHADHLLTDIPCAAPMDDTMIAGDYEYQTGYQILHCLESRGLSYKDIEMMLVGSHAPFTWGSTMEKALYHSVILEELAKMAFLTERINPSVSRLKPALIRKHHERKHGKNAYYGQ